MEAQPALGWTAGDVVLDAVASENLDAAVVPADWEAHRQFALRDAQHRPQAGFEAQVVGRGVELILCRGEGPGSGGHGRGGRGRRGRGGERLRPDEILLCGHRRRLAGDRERRP